MPAFLAEQGVSELELSFSHLDIFKLNLQTSFVYFIHTFLLIFGVSHNKPDFGPV